MEDVERRLEPDDQRAVRQLYDWAREHADQITWGTGKQRGSFSPKFDHVNETRSPFSVLSDGALWLNLRFLEDEHSRGYAERLGRELREEIEAFQLPEDVFVRLPEIPIETWREHVEEFLEVVEGILVSDPRATATR